MAITRDQKTEIITANRRGAQDTGSPEVQVGILTARIQDLTVHLKAHAKDHASRRGLIQMVMKRNALLKYLKGISQSKYQELIHRLGLRK